MPVPSVSFSRFVAVCVVIGALAVLPACGDDGGSSGQDTSSRESDVYAAIVVSVAADQPHDEEDQKPIVYVSPFPNDKPIPLDVQVGVVDTVGDNAVVRFVDEEEQAINKDAEGEPVVDDGVLVRLGTVPADGTTVTVAAELYHNDNDIVPTEYKVTEQGDTWVATQQSTASG